MSSAAEKKKNKGKQQAAVEQIDSSAKADKPSGDDNIHPFERELNKKLRNSRKKLGQIAELIKKQKSKEIVLSEEQKEKVSKQQELEEEIKDTEEYLKMFQESQAIEAKKAKEAEKLHQQDLKKARDTTISHLADMLTMHNLRMRGVEMDEKISAGVGVFSATLEEVMAGKGEAQQKEGRDDFSQKWTSLVTKSKQVVPGQEITYSDLAEGIANLLASGTFPDKVPGKKAAPVEEPKKKKEPKPLPADYIKKAGAAKEVAEEDKQEEVVDAPVDEDFLGGFDAFDEDDDDEQAPPKEEPKKVEAPAEEAKTGDNAEAAGEDSPDADGNRGGRGRGGRGRGRWEDGENRGRGRARGERGRGGRGRGRGGNQQDEEGFEVVVQDQKRGRGGRGRGRGRGDRGDRGGRGRGGERPKTAGGDETGGARGGGERGTRGGRPQTSRMKSDQIDGEEAKNEVAASQQTKGEEKKE